MKTLSAALSALLLVAGSRNLVSQARPLSTGDVEELLGSRVSDVRIIQLAQRDCLLFRPDARIEKHLRASYGASAGLLQGLRAACYAGAALEVTSEPAGLEVWLGEQLVGTTPWTSDEVLPGAVTIGAGRGEQRQRVTATIPVARLVRVHFVALEDTLPWPVEPTRGELGAALDRSMDWVPSRPEPVAPEAIPGGRPKSRQIVGAIAGALAGGAVGYAIDPNTDSLSTTVVGAALVGALGWWVGKKLDDAAYRRRLRVGEQRVQEYDAAMTAWRQQLAAERAERLNLLIDSALVGEHRRAEELRAPVRAQNEGIRRRNAAAPAPRVTVERMP